jgi:TorA maturation chaperone TorD
MGDGVVDTETDGTPGAGTASDGTADSDLDFDAAADSDAGLDAAFASARARVYDLLSRAFDGQTDALAAALDDGVFVDVTDALPVTVDTEPLEAGEYDADALAIGYDNLFVVPGPHYVPPFASAHADDPSESVDSDSAFYDGESAGELLGDPAAEMAALYEQTAFEPQRGDGIPDHLAAQLEFLATLAATEAERLADADATHDVRALQRAVVQQLAWLDAFDAAVADADRAEGVFAALARITRTIVAQDAEWLADTTSP